MTRKLPEGTRVTYGPDNTGTIIETPETGPDRGTVLICPDGDGVFVRVERDQVAPAATR